MYAIGVLGVFATLVGLISGIPWADKEALEEVKAEIREHRYVLGRGQQEIAGVLAEMRGVGNQLNRLDVKVDAILSRWQASTAPKPSAVLQHTPVEFQLLERFNPPEDPETPAPLTPRLLPLYNGKRTPP